MAEGKGNKPLWWLNDRPLFLHLFDYRRYLEGERRIKTALTFRAIESVAIVLAAMAVMICLQSMKIKYDVPFEKAETIGVGEKYSAAKGFIIIIRDTEELRRQEKTLGVDLPEGLLKDYILVAAYNYKINRITGGFTKGRDEIDVMRMKYRRLTGGDGTDAISVYKIKRSLFYR